MMVDPRRPPAAVSRADTDRLLSLVTALVVAAGVNAVLLLVIAWKAMEFVR
jgi:hypothetical protein